MGDISYIETLIYMGLSKKGLHQDLIIIFPTKFIILGISPISIYFQSKSSGFVWK